MTTTTNHDPGEAHRTENQSAERSTTFVVLVIIIIFLSLLVVLVGMHRRLYLSFDPQYIMNTYLADCDGEIEDYYGEVWIRDCGTKVIVVRSKGDELTCLPVNDEGFGGLHDDGLTLTWHRSGIFYYLFVSYGEGLGSEPE